MYLEVRGHCRATHGLEALASRRTRWWGARGRTAERTLRKIVQPGAGCLPVARAAEEHEPSRRAARGTTPLETFCAPPSPASRGRLWPSRARSAGRATGCRDAPVCASPACAATWPGRRAARRRFRPASRRRREPAPGRPRGFPPSKSCPRITVLQCALRRGWRNPLPAGESRRAG